MEVNSVNVKKREKEIEDIIVKYDDGSEDVVSKGMLITLSEDDDVANLNMKFADFTREDLVTVAYAFLEMSAKLGLLEDIQ
jgi:hypothetical protein